MFKIPPWAGVCGNRYRYFAVIQEEETAMSGMNCKIDIPSTNEMEQFPDSMEKKEIASVAYALWQSRGCPLGSPEADWFRAEREVRARRPAAILDHPLPRR